MQAALAHFRHRGEYDVITSAFLVHSAFMAVVSRFDGTATISFVLTGLRSILLSLVFSRLLADLTNKSCLVTDSIFFGF